MTLESIGRSYEGRDIRLATVGHLARAWGRHWSTFALGMAGDLLTRSAPSRRSTIVVQATAPISMGRWASRAAGPGQPPEAPSEVVVEGPAG